MDTGMAMLPGARRCREGPTMKSLPPLFCLALMATTASCSGGDGAIPKGDPARVVDAIKADEVHWNADWKSGDPEKVAAHFGSGAVVMIPGAAPLVGAAAIKAGVQQAMNDPDFAYAFASDKVQVASSGDLAVSRGAYTETSDDPAAKTKVTTAGTFVTVYKPQADGVWRAVWDISTPGAPAAPAP
jgi:ketosteroid isomerase-like protein